MAERDLKTELETARAGKTKIYKPTKMTKSLKYPLTLSTEDFFPDAVCFTIMKRTGVSIHDVSEVVGKSAAFAVHGAKKATGMGNANTSLGWMDDKQQKELASIADKDISDTKKEQEMQAAVKAAWDAETRDGGPPENVFEIVTGSLARFAGGMVGKQNNALNKAAARKKLDVRKGGTDIMGSIYMNMPAGITFTDKANWAGGELGVVSKLVKDVIGGSGETGSTAAGALAGGAGNIAGAAVGGIGALAAKMGLKGGLMGMAVGAAAGGGVIQKGAEAALGVSMNPYMEMMFSGIGFRDFTFDFTMRPRNEKEMQEVDEIIRTFRTHTRPSWVGGTLGKSFMDYPMQFNIQFLTAKEKGSAESYALNDYIPKIKTCVCDSVTTNYSPQNMWTAHRNGAPIAITLGLHFLETELVMATDVRDDKF